MQEGKRAEFNMHLFGRNLKKFREKKGLSVEEVRAYLGLGSVQSVYQYENGIAMPRADALLSLMELYEITPADLKRDELP